MQKLSVLGQGTSLLALFLLFSAQSAYSQPANGFFTVNKTYDDGNTTPVTVTADLYR